MSRRTADRPGSVAEDSPHGRARNGGAASEPSRSSLPGLEQGDLDIDPNELREFLSADVLAPPANPVFKERLRRKLWRLVRTRYGTPRADEEAE